MRRAVASRGADRERGAVVVGGARQLELADAFDRGRGARLAEPDRRGVAAHAGAARHARRRARVRRSVLLRHRRALAPLVARGRVRLPAAALGVRLAAARLGWPLQDTDGLPARSRAARKSSVTCAGRAHACAVLGRRRRRASSRGCSRERGFGASRLTCSSAGRSRRARAHTSAKALSTGDVDALNAIAVELVAGPRSRLVPFAAGRNDAFRERRAADQARRARDHPLRARARARASCCGTSALGSGSIAIEWMLCDPACRPSASRSAPRASASRRNARQLGVPASEIVQGERRRRCGLAAPDAVFIGGGLGDRRARGALGRAEPGGRLVINAVTLETQSRCSRPSSSGAASCRASTSHAPTARRDDGWRPALPVTQWRVVKP